jgi:hypothetical protein
MQQDTMDEKLIATVRQGPTDAVRNVKIKNIIPSLDVPIISNKYERNICTLVPLKVLYLLIDKMSQLKL